MKIKAQISMVMNLDKCIGCNTCSVTCKNTWTNREGAEYMWFNNVETKPGIGYPKDWENQEEYKGGWILKNNKKLQLRLGSRIFEYLNIFHNPALPTIDNYYEPWTYNYGNLIEAKLSKHQPVIKPISVLTGDPIQLKWGPNWEDDLAGAHITGLQDQNIKKIEEEIKMEYEETFMTYLPRICEHCLNPACVAACPSGAIYKREEDGIVLVDQDACRGWRFCISACPYKKIYFNWTTHKSEKCIFCYPRIEAGLPTVCSETCVGKIRYIGVVLYDADRVEEIATLEDEKQLYPGQLSLFLDPNDPEVIEQARKDGITDDWIEAAQRSPIYKLAIEQGIALPLHPEYRTLPMVWYVPPLSPIMKRFEDEDKTTDPTEIFPTIDKMRIPIKFLANLLTAGDEEVIKKVLKKMVLMRQYMRSKEIGKPFNENLLKAVGLDTRTVEEMYRLLAIAKYEDRFVIPTTHREQFENLNEFQGYDGFECSIGAFDSCFPNPTKS